MVVTSLYVEIPLSGEGKLNVVVQGGGKRPILFSVVRDGEVIKERTTFSLSKTDLEKLIPFLVSAKKAFEGEWD